MQPAYHIPLSPSEKKLIAELAAIQSQIEWLMATAVTHLLNVTPETARVLMGSTSIAANASIWIAIVRERLADKDALAGQSALILG